MTTPAKPAPAPAVVTLEEANKALEAVLGLENSPLAKVMERAEKVIAVWEWLKHPEVEKRILKLKNTPAGFETDEGGYKNKPAYSPQIVCTCVADAILHGFNLVGNEFNIIAGRFYGTLNGYTRKVREYKGENYRIVALEVIEGDVTLNGAMVKIPMGVEYVIEDNEGVRKTLKFDRIITIKSLGNFETPDLWVGKATRRILKRLYAKLDGTEFGDDLGAGGSDSFDQGAKTSSMPPDGSVSLKKDPPPVQKADDAAFTEAIGNAKLAEKPQAEPEPAPRQERQSPPPPMPGDSF